jgi:ParB-like chromosome segregation protein Spo0J
MDRVSQINGLISALSDLEIKDRVCAINEIRAAIHSISPFKDEPVDFVRWVPSESVEANDYNPNSVAPPEMELLRVSIMADGYTQPIVTNDEGERFVVIDGFHRNRVGKECKDVRERVLGYLPVVQIKDSQTDRGNRIASTIRHNRARGKHKVEAMADIVVELKRRNWSDDKIGRELGMDPDEVLRLSQITGLAEMFADQDFSAAWDVGVDDGAGGDVISDIGESDVASGSRILHTWEKWECFRNGFYDDRPPGGISQEDGEEKYREFLSDLQRFEAALSVVTGEWKFSCEHYLTNERMDRIAWLGQAAAAQAMRMPSCCRGGYNLLSDSQKAGADAMALKYLNIWLSSNGRDPVTYESALSRTQAELY